MHVKQNAFHNNGPHSDILSYCLTFITSWQKEEDKIGKQYADTPSETSR